MKSKAGMLRVLAAAYAPVACDATWLSGLVEAARPLLDRGLGVAGFYYDWSAPPERRVLHPVASGTPPGALEALTMLNALAPEDATRLLMRADPTCATLSTRLAVGACGLDHELLNNVLGPLGVRDFMAVAATSVDGPGCLIGAPLPAVTTVPRLESATWDRVAAHMSAGLRHRERVRATRREVEPDEAWRGLVAGSWSLVDQFDHDGKRYIVARRNGPETDSNSPYDSSGTVLDAREERVVAYAAEGLSNKEIAYELSMAISTVARHLASARAKLGVSSRARLIRAYAARRAHRTN